MSPDEVAFVTMEEDRLFVQQLPYPRLPLAPLGNHRFQILGTEFHIQFHITKSNDAESLLMSYAPDRRAMRMTKDTNWPVQDLLLGDSSKAIIEYRNSHKEDAENPMVDCDRLIQLTMGLLKFGRPEAALALGKTISDLYPNDAGVWDVLGQVNAELGNRESALKAYHECLRRIADDDSIDDTERDRLQAHTQARLRWLEK